MIREGALNRAHVESLQSCPSAWPPIVVRLLDYQVIDGMHRLAAARATGQEWIRGVLLDGDEAACWVEAVRANASHGLPLTASERRRAIAGIVRFHPEWSDRRIAEIVRVSPSTIRSVRSDVARTAAAEASGRLTRRVGRDGRQRPAHVEPCRERVEATLAAHPGGSLREIAKIVGTSPETVRRVRMRLGAAGTRGAAGQELKVLVQLPAERGGVSPGNMCEDRALVADGGDLLSFLRVTAVDQDPAAVAARVPLGRVYDIADEALRRAVFWSDLAHALDRRARDSTRLAWAVGGH